MNPAQPGTTPTPAAPLQRNLLLVVIVLFSFAIFTYANATLLDAISDSKTPLDFLFRWVPTRQFIHGEIDDIYSLDANQEIQKYMFGEVIEDTETKGHFSYPFYAMFLYIPFALIGNYQVAFALFMTCLQLSNIAIIYFTAKTLSFALSKQNFALFALLALLGAEYILSFIDGNPASLITLFMVLSLYFVKNEKEIAAGFFVALTSIKPQLSLFFILILMAWAFFNKQWKLILSAIASVIGLLGLSFLVQPDWLKGFLQHVFVYDSFSFPNSPREIFHSFGAGPAGMVVVLFTLVAIMVLLVAVLELRKLTFDALLFSIAIAQTTIPLLGLPTLKYNLIAFLPGFVLTLSWLTQTLLDQKRLKWILIGNFVLGWLLTVGTYLISQHYFPITDVDIYVFTLLYLTYLLVMKRTMERKSTQTAAPSSTTAQ